ncbi:MAG: carbon starvation protein A [Candidatus Omnitrophota bacterium]|nr:MAG: carbon starvation protein A [Candidatus Omnitrophota bacterium]
MSSIIIVIASGVLFLFGYTVYSKIIERFLKIDPKRKTPAYRKYDGVDYVPAKHWSILFGHHFASIAGAAPIIGPVLAVSIWGWMPTLLWVVLGTIFIGGIHDYSSLIISARHNGTSIADIAKDAISKNAKIVFLIFLWLTLVLIISVFVHICAKTFVVKAEIVIPSLGLIPIAVLVGFLLYNLKFHQPTVTILGLALMAGSIFLGRYYPIVLGEHALQIWSVVLLIYAFFASVTPVNILLQPRDYLASFLLLFGIVFGYLGILSTRPDIHFPAFMGWSGIGNNLALWPILFVTVACGAISGFHSVVASGTTSKQLASEKHARRIGYGGMLAEGILAVMAILVIAAAFKDKNVLQDMVQRGAGPIGAFSIGYNEVTKGFLGTFGGVFAIMILNAFILTTLDTATRIGRYLTQELFKIKNRFAATIIVVALAGWLGLSGEWNEIWPIFGSANQLVAALALIVVTSWFLSRRKPVLYTLIPMLFMLATATGALVLKILEYIKTQNALLLGIAFVLLGLSIFILFEAILAIRRIFRAKRNALGIK